MAAILAPVAGTAGQLALAALLIEQEVEAIVERLRKPQAREVLRLGTVS